VKSISVTEALSAPTNALEFMSLKKPPTKYPASSTTKTESAPAVFEEKKDDFPSLM